MQTISLPRLILPAILGFSLLARVESASAADAFANRTPLTGYTVVVTDSNVGATLENEEPRHAGATGGASLWWSWVAPANGVVTLHTAASDFDTLLAVYTGQTLNNLSEVASNDQDPFGGDQSWLTFVAVAGTSYAIAVDGYFGDEGTVVLSLELAIPPANDDFAGAFELSGVSGLTSGTNSHAGTEADEPNHGGQNGGHSVWWRWTAPASGRFAMTVSNATFAPVAAAYTGASVDALNHIATGVSSAGSAVTVSFDAAGGTTYFLAVDSSIPGDAGTFDLSFQLAVNQYAVVPLEDSPEGGSISLAPSPNPLGLYPSGTMVTATATNHPGFVFAGWTGAATSLNTTVTFPVNSSVRIIGRFVPLNDAFANRIILSGTSFSTNGFTSGATSEAGEPEHAGRPGGRSVWWTWTAPSDGLAEIRTDGSAIDTLLAVYTGASPGALSPVAANDDSASYPGPSSVAFAAVAGTSYQIAVDAFGGVGGAVELNLILTAHAPEPMALAIHPGTLQGNGSVVWSFPAEPGIQYRVESSINLQTWTPLFTTNAPGPLIQFDLVTAASPFRFLRAVRTSGLATLQIRAYLETPEFPAPEGSAIWLNGAVVGSTDVDGMAVLSVAAGIQEVRVVLPGVAGGTVNTNLGTGQTATMDVFLSGEALEREGILHCPQLKDGVLPTTPFPGMAVELRDERGLARAINVVFDFRGESVDGTIDLLPYFMLTGDGRLVASDPTGLRTALLQAAETEIVATLFAEDTAGESWHAQLHFRLGRHLVEGQLLAPVSLSSLSVAGRPVKASIAGTGIIRFTSTDAEGNFSFPQLPNGVITLTAAIEEGGITYSADYFGQLEAGIFTELALRGPDDPLPSQISQSFAPAVQRDPVEQARRLKLAQELAPRRAAGRSFSPASEDSVTVEVTGEDEDALISETAELAVPAGTKKVYLKYIVFTEEYPYYVLQDSIFNDYWRIAITKASGGNLATPIARNINSQRTARPIWLADGSTGLIQEEYDVSALTTRDTTLKITAATKNISDGILPTTVTATLALGPSFVIDEVVPSPGEGGYTGYSVPRPGDGNTAHRSLDIKLKGRPAGSTIENVKVDLIENASEDVLMTVVDEGPGTLVQEVNAKTLRVRVTAATSTVGSTPPGVHNIRYRVTVMLDDAGEPLEDTKDSPVKFALWRMPDGFARYGARDPGWDDWCAKGTYEWMQEYSDRLTRIDDISGEHGRNIGHATHRNGTDLDIYQFTDLLTTAAKSGTANYLQMAAKTKQALAGNAAARTVVIGWISDNRAGLDELIVLGTVTRLFSGIGSADGILPSGWLQTLMTTGELTANNGTTLDTGLGTWDSTGIIFNAVHNSHHHVDLEDSALNNDP